MRGATSIYGNSTPLWIVDGVIQENVIEVNTDDLSSGNAETLLSSARMPYVNTLDSVVSMYSMKNDNGIVLSFDTYNAFFHYYADQSQYFAQELQGDFEFCLDRYSANEDTIWMDGDDPSIDGHLYSYGNLVGGIYFLEPIEYKGHVIREMHIKADKSGYDDIYDQAQIIPKPFANYFLQDEEYDSRFFGYSALGPWTQQQWDKAREALTASGVYDPNSLVYVCIYTDGKGEFHLIFNMWYGSGEIHYPMEMRKVSNDEIALRWTGEEHHGLGVNLYEAGFRYFVDALATKDEWRTYRISAQTGSVMSPGELKLTDEQNPDNSFYFPTYFRYYHQSIWD